MSILLLLLLAACGPLKWALGNTTRGCCLPCWLLCVVVVVNDLDPVSVSLSFFLSMVGGWPTQPMKNVR